MQEMDDIMSDEYVMLGIAYRYASVVKHLGLTEVAICSQRLDSGKGKNAVCPRGEILTGVGDTFRLNPPRFCLDCGSTMVIYTRYPALLK